MPELSQIFVGLEMFDPATMILTLLGVGAYANWRELLHRVGNFWLRFRGKGDQCKPWRGNGIYGEIRETLKELRETNKELAKELAWVKEVIAVHSDRYKRINGRLKALEKPGGEPEEEDVGNHPIEPRHAS